MATVVLPAFGWRGVQGRLVRSKGLDRKRRQTDLPVCRLCGFHGADAEAGRYGTRSFRYDSAWSWNICCHSSRQKKPHKLRENAPSPLILEMTFALSTYSR